MDYFIAATPRVGSNLLCSFLGGTRKIGFPREYLCQTELGDYAPLIQQNPREFNSYYEDCRQQHTLNGVFGVKAHYAQLQWAAQHGFDLQRFFPERFIYISRADRVGQAISHVRALQTGAWISKKVEQTEPRFEPERIHGALRRIVDENHAWEAFFRHHDVEPFRLGYETLCADFEGEVRRVLRFLDVDPNTVDLGKIVEGTLGYFDKQRDETSEQWRDRYADWLRVRASRGAAARAVRQRHAS